MMTANCSFPPVGSDTGSPRALALRAAVPVVWRAGGFSLLELMLAIALVSCLAIISVVGFGAILERTRISRAVADIGEIQLLIRKFNADFDRFPDTLAEAGVAGRLDPWDHPYRYLNFAGLNGTGQMRKDRNLVPINSDFDLYSVGPDGDSRPPLNARLSRDDIVRANDGRFVGKAEDY